MKIEPDDPRLTAFALGELEGEEQARVAAAVAADPALQAIVDDVAGTARQLTAALAAEPTPEFDPIELPAVRLAPVRRTSRPAARARLFQFPYVAVGSLAAACFVVVFLILNQNEHAAREAARRTATAATEQENRAVVALEPVVPRETAATGALIPDTLPLVARDTTSILVTPEAASTFPAPTATSAPDIALTVPTVPPESPNTTPITVRQTPATAPQVATGISHDSPSNATSATRNRALAPTPVLADNAATSARGFLDQTTLLPPGTSTLPSGNHAAGNYQDILADGASTGDHLRTNFRDFGAARYASNRTVPLPGNAASPPGSDTFASNPATSERTSGPALPDLADDSQRVPEDNIKTTTTRPLRLPFEGPAAGVSLREEIDRRGTLDRGGQIPDLETQLRDLQQTDRSLDSPVQDFVRDNAFVPTTENPAPVFPIEVDAASHVKVRRALLAGTRPSRDTVRIEELLNHHVYDYAAPSAESTAPFAASLEVASAPWASHHRLVRVGLKAREVVPAARPPAHFVLLIETADAAADDSHLELIKESLRQFVEQLNPQDQVAIAVHSATASLALPSTAASERDTILAALEKVRSTGAATETTGLQLAFDIARAHFIPGGINRVIFATDGDTRISESRREAAVRLIDDQARGGIALSALGFGVRDIRESALEAMEHRSSGEFVFVDTLRDAQRVLRDRADGGFTPVARNVKVQVEFNAAQVHSWRLIGYEDRVYLREDFDHESLAADAVGAGHAITALFEIVPIGQPPPSIDDTVAVESEMLTVKVRYAAPEDDHARLQQFSLTDTGGAFDAASTDFKFAAAVAGFGMILRESPHQGSATIADVATWARAGIGTDRDGSRAEFAGLVDRLGKLVR